MTFLKPTTIKITTILLIFLSLTLRVISIPYTNQDLALYNLPWYQTLYQKGIIDALGTNFSNYAPPYTYFLALATLAFDFVPPLTAIKLIPTCFDLLGAFFIYKIVKIKYQQGDTSYLAAVVYFTAPTVILNSAYWGQADSLYASILLACIYFLITEKPFISILAFGMAFSIKAQAVFLLPFLGIMAIRKKIPWLYIGMIPLIYLLAILPVVLLGRPFLDALLIYVKQSDSYPALSMNAPNIYILFADDWYKFILPLGITITIILISCWIYTTSQSRVNLDNKYLILIALISTALTPFILPKMHDRYFYPADVLSILLAFYWPSLWYIPVLYQFVSLSAISGFLFDTAISFIVFGFLLNTIAIVIILRTQRTIENRAATNQTIATALSWLVAILVPVILYVISLNILLTPSFIRLNYSMPNNPAEQYSLSKSERFQWASQSMKYLTNDRNNQFLAKLKFDNGASVFSNHEIAALDNIKGMTQRAIMIRNVSLAFCFVLGSLAWAGDWLQQLRQGIRRGGWLTIGLAVMLGIAGGISGFNPNDYFKSAEIIPQLFPIDFWQDLLIFILLILCGSGFLLTRITVKR